MQGLILAAGKGERMLLLTKYIPKPMLLCAGKTILAYCLDTLSSLGITDIIIVIGYLKEKIIDFFEKKENIGLDIKFIVQEEQLGVAHAVNLAHKYINSDFILHMGDNIFLHDITPIVEKHKEKKSDVTLILEKAKYPFETALVRLNSENRITKIEEKPTTIFSDISTTGIYLFSSKIFAALKDLPTSTQREYSLADAINLQLERNRNFRAFGYFYEGWRMNITRPSDLIKANRSVFDMTLKNRKIIKKGVSMDSETKIIPPVFIGENTQIEKSQIGPYSTIGSNVKIHKDTIIKNSIILDRTEIFEKENLINTIAIAEIRKKINVIEKDTLI